MGHRAGRIPDVTCELCVHICVFQQLAKLIPLEDNLELVSHKIVIDKLINPYRSPFCASELDDLVPQIRTTSMVDMFWQKVLAKFLSSSFQFFGLHQAIWFYTRITTWNLGDFFLGDLALSWRFTLAYELWSNKNGGFFCPGDRSIPISLFRLCESHCSKLQEAKGRGADDGMRDQIIGFDVLYIYINCKYDVGLMYVPAFKSTQTHGILFFPWYQGLAHPVNLSANDV